MGRSVRDRFGFRPTQLWRNTLKVHGNLNGLKPGQRDRLARIYDRKVSREEIISVPLAQTIVELSHDMGRQVGVTIDRRGRVGHVIVGDAQALFIPDLGRARAGMGRFRGIRLIHTHLRNEPLSQEDLTDLSRLRFDLIAAIGVGPEGRPATMYHTHLMPPGSPEPYARPTVTTVHDQTGDFSAFIDALEEEFSRETVGALETAGQVRAIAVHVSVDDRLDPKESLRELTELARTAGVVLVDAVIQNRKAIDPKYIMGKGKLDELLLRTMQLDCELVIFDQNLAPNQVRSITDVTDVKVIDRSQLILDIFAQRAHTREGKLAVELAMLKYQLPRLVGKGTSMSRLMGGIGGRGPGETKLETDRRKARDRIHWLEQQLETTRVQRANRRSKRQRGEVPIVALVGYTNAGKSTLFNGLTHSSVLVEDKLFATLHTTTRRLRFPQERELIIIDTVGFIRDLPEDLRVAFRATLEELVEADLFLHVIDMADPRMDHQIASVEQVLEDMELLDTPRIKVFNKMDLLDTDIAENICRHHDAFGVNATDRRTTRALMMALESRLWQAGAMAPPPSTYDGGPLDDDFPVSVLDELDDYDDGIEVECGDAEVDVGQGGESKD